jgi:hypothetical protein
LWKFRCVRFSATSMPSEKAPLWRPRSVLGAATILAITVMFSSGCADAGEPSVALGAAASGTPSVALAIVSSARIGGDDRTVTVDVVREPDCFDNERASVDEENERAVYVRVSMDAIGMPPGQKCPPRGTKAVTVQLSAPLGQRDLVVNNDLSFTRGTDGGLRQCDRELGCHPAPTGCTAESYQTALFAADTPRHATWNAQACDGTWLILDIDTGQAACPVTGDGSGPCAGLHRITRWFYRAEPDGWSTLTTTRQGGCPAALPAAFPTRLCSALPKPS